LISYASFIALTPRSIKVSNGNSIFATLLKSFPPPKGECLALG